MYKISVPVMNGTLKRVGRERVLEECKRFDAERIFLALDTYETDLQKRKIALEELADNCRFFRERGLEVGAWIWTFWLKNNTEFQNMRSLTGQELSEFMCPTDANFVKFATDYIRDIAKCGVDIIQFDDDFRYGFLGDSAACLCDTHISEINRITKENSTRESLAHSITTGGKNKFRDAFLQVNGDAFRRFAKEVRRAVDEINPAIRISLCTCMSSWDLDGTDAHELATLLAGNTRPLLRLIGAPYWAVKKSWGNSLQDVIELERMESAWIKSEKTEIMAEGDAFPRPRIHCPAAYLEGFDTAVRACGCTDGILKYGIDYTSNADYETGYAKFHERNRPLYREIDRLFSEKTNCGIRVYESMKKITDMVMPTKVNDRVEIQDLFFSKAARTLSHNSIPTVYEGEGVCGIVFDENARSLSTKALKNGLILDIAAAEILTERGIDVGLSAIGNPIDFHSGATEERFLSDQNHIALNGAVVYDINVGENAQILSDTETKNGRVPISYRYENADGNRFLVLNVNTRSENSDAMLRHYARSRQYATIVPWLSGQKLPAYVYGHPSLYIQTKETTEKPKETRLAVGMWNFFPDTVIEPTIELGKRYTEIEFVNCSGKLSGDKVYLTDIAPFGFAAFQVK